MLGWKACTSYYETDELPNPRPTQPPKNLVESGTWATFSHSKYFFVGWDWSYIGNTDYKKPNPTKLSANTLLCCLRQQSVHWTVSVHGVHYCVGRGWLGAEKMARKVCPLRVCNLRRWWDDFFFSVFALSTRNSVCMVFPSYIIAFFLDIRQIKYAGNIYWQAQPVGSCCQ